MNQGTDGLTQCMKTCAMVFCAGQVVQCDGGVGGHHVRHPWQVCLPQRLGDRQAKQASLYINLMAKIYADAAITLRPDVKRGRSLCCGLL